MKFGVLALDYDGTIAKDGALDSDVPHRIVVDEAHYFLHDSDVVRLLDLELAGYTLVTYQVSGINSDVLNATEAIIVTRETDQREVRALRAKRTRVVLIYLCRSFQFSITAESRMTSTEQCACIATASETLPIRTRLIPRRPCEPTIIRSAPHLLASSTITDCG